MRLILTIFLSLMAVEAFAQSADYRVNPRRPVKGEIFEVVFTIETSSTEVPYISFNPGRLRVEGRGRGGVSMSTTIINGRISKTREVQYIYQMVADTAGIYQLTNVKVDIEGKTLRLPTKSISVSSRPARARAIFLQAEVSKEKVFVGEGVDLKYYLYSRADISDFQVTKFPELKELYKRNYKFNESLETVDLNGVLYRRSLKYAARVFPSKKGTVKIDPLKMKVAYVARGNGFGGSIFGQVRTKILASQIIKLEVLPIPSENIPKDFIGLVGRHEFILNVQRPKIIVNDVLEARLEIQGPGPLENIGAPQILTSDLVEEFDSKGSFTPQGESLGKKTFDYTFLARSGGLIEEKKLSFSIFDPETLSFVTKEVIFPEITIAGAQSTIVSSSRNESASSSDTTKEKEIVKAVEGPVMPDFSPSSISNYIPLAIILLLSLLNFTILTEWALRSYRTLDEYKSLIGLESKVKSGQGYSEVYRFLEVWTKSVSSSKEESPFAAMVEKKIDPKTIEYFKLMLKFGASKEFANSKIQGKSPQYERKHFKNLLRVVKKGEWKTLTQSNHS